MSDAHPDPASDGWHLDKRIPIALVVTILLQTVGAIWWAATISARVTALEDKPPERLVRVETQVEGINKTLERIEQKLDRTLDPDRP